MRGAASEGRGKLNELHTHLDLLLSASHLRRIHVIAAIKESYRTIRDRIMDYFEGVGTTLFVKNLAEDFAVVGAEGAHGDFA